MRFVILIFRCSFHARSWFSLVTVDFLGLALVVCSCSNNLFLSAQYLLGVVVRSRSVRSSWCWQLCLLFCIVLLFCQSLLACLYCWTIYDVLSAHHPCGLSISTYRKKIFMCFALLDIPMGDPHSTYNPNQLFNKILISLSSTCTTPILLKLLLQSMTPTQQE